MSKNNTNNNMSSWLGAALGGLGSIFGGLLGKSGQDAANAANLQIARETNEANRNNQEYQNNWNLNMWNMQNRYNTPAEQRKRLEDAGLNPIFYGLDGTGNAGALQSAPFTAVPGAPMSNSGAFLGQGISNAALQAAQIANIQADTKQKEADTRGQSLQNEILNASKGDIISYNHVQVRVSETQADLNEATADEKAKHIEEMDTNIQYMNTLIDQICQNMDYQHLQYALDNWYKHKEMELNERHLSNEERQIALNELNGQRDFVIASYNAKTNRMNAETNQQNAATTALRYSWLTLSEAMKLPGELRIQDGQYQFYTSSAELNNWKSVGVQIDNASNARAYALNLGSDGKIDPERMFVSLIDVLANVKAYQMGLAQQPEGYATFNATQALGGNQNVLGDKYKSNNN